MADPRPRKQRRSWVGATWKDEWILILWSLPMLFAFIPGMHDHIRIGFEILRDSVPTEYLAGWSVIISGSYGMSLYHRHARAQAVETAIAATTNPDKPAQ